MFTIFSSLAFVKINLWPYGMNSKRYGFFFLIIVGKSIYIAEGSVMKGQHFNPNRHACWKNLVLIVSSMNVSDGQVK